MGCDIHSFVERRRGGNWEHVEADMGRPRYENCPFGWRNYGVFGFLADVRNYSMVPPITERRGLPDDLSSGVREGLGEWLDFHSASWLTVAELLAVDYDAEFENRRIARRMPGGWIDGGVTAEPGGGNRTTLREFLGRMFFDDLERLRAIGDPQNTRVVFWFDN